MKDPVVNEALRQIQDIVRQETGNPLAGSAKSRVERVLTNDPVMGIFRHVDGFGQARLCTRHAAPGVEQIVKPRKSRFGRLRGHRWPRRGPCG